MADKITNLKNWKNGEKLNARDYMYERTKIVDTIDDIIDEQDTQEQDIDQLKTEMDSAEGRLDTNEQDIINNTSTGQGIISGSFPVNKARVLDDDQGNVVTAQQAAQIVAKSGNIDTAFNHVSATDNPHSVTKSQVGLNNVDNTSDADKPISTATQSALNNKADTNALTSHTDDATIHFTKASLEKADVGLGNVLNVAQIPTSEKGEDGGVAPLDENGRIPSKHLTINAIELKGTFGSTASSLNGDLPTTEVTRGDMYICDENDYESTVAGITFNNGDKAIYDGTNWVKNDAADAVTSVNNQTGTVTLKAANIEVVSSGFDGELVNTDNTVQKALDRLDDHNHVEADITDLDKYSKTAVDALLADKVNITDLDTSIAFYPTTTQEDGGSFDEFNQMVVSQTDNRYDTNEVEIFTTSDGTSSGTPSITSTNFDNPTVIAELIADAGEFEVIKANTEIITVGELRKKVQGSPSEMPNAFVRFKVYKSDDLVNDIAESGYVGPVDSTDWTELFERAVVSNDVNFSETDRLVIKYEAYGSSSGAIVGIKFGGETPVRTIIPKAFDATIAADKVIYNNEDSTLTSSNIKAAMDELDTKVESNITAVQVESFDIVTANNGDGTFTYRDSNNIDQTGTIDAEGFYIFDLQVAGYYANRNLVEVNINDDVHYYTSDTNQLREGPPDSEDIVTSVKINHGFVIGDEVDIKYFQGINIVAQSIGDGSVSFGKLDATLQGDITELQNASSTNPSQGAEITETIVKRNASNEFEGILDGKFKTSRTITLDGDVSGSVNFDGSSNVIISTAVANNSHTHTNLGGAGLTYNSNTEKYDVDIKQLDDVLEFNNFEALQAYENPEEGILYVTTNDNTIYRWTGSQFTSLGNPTEAINTHRDANYPHRFTDPNTSTVYEWGLGVENGELGIIYREVNE